jgi:putative thioredoxin
LAENYEAALQGLLAIVSKDRTYRSDGARKTMLLIFTLLGDDHPLTKHYRKQLTLTLY